MSLRVKYKCKKALLFLSAVYICSYQQKYNKNINPSIVIIVVVISIISFIIIHHHIHRHSHIYFHIHLLFIFAFIFSVISVTKGETTIVIYRHHLTTDGGSSLKIKDGD